MEMLERANELHKELRDRGCLNYLSTSREIIIKYFSKLEDEKIQTTKTIGKLEAKVFAYEAIISNSNFAMATMENKENTTEISNYAYASHAIEGEQISE